MSCHTFRALGVCLTVVLSASWAAAATDQELAELQDGFEDRRETIIGLLEGEPLEVAPQRDPLGPDRPIYTRHYSYSIVSFAMKAFWLGEEEFYDEANAALIENSELYLGNTALRDDRDSFYWAADVLCRIVEFFGSDGTVAPGRLSSEAEEVILEMMWDYARDRSRLADAEIRQSQTWHVHESENHHIQLFSALWHFSKLLSERPEYRGREYGDGATAGEHYRAWTAYARAYLRERVRKGLFIEMAHKGYHAHTLKGIYNFHDFADDAALRAMSRKLLDVYWATWAQEQIGGVRGGAASRVYQGGSSRGAFGDEVRRWAGFYLGRGTDEAASNNAFTPLTSEYRMPPVVMDLALDAEGRGVYELRQRRLGLAQEGYFGNPDYRLRTDYGGIVRYSYCTPEFIVGTALLEARDWEDWVLISSQNRWHGVIFAGHEHARIVPECVADQPTFNQHWSVQRQGTLIVQKLEGNRHAQEMRVWFTEPGLDNRQERDGWAFVEAEGAYAAVRPVAGGYRWEPEENHQPAGFWMHLEDEWSPVILEVGRKADFDSYEAFQEAVVAGELTFEDEVLRYEGLGGDTFTFFADQTEPPRVNGTRVDYAPEMALDSPFVQSRWNSGVVTIRKGERERVVDMNDPLSE